MPAVGDFMTTAPGMNIVFTYTEGGVDYRYELGMFGATSTQRLARRTGANAAPALSFTDDISAGTVSTDQFTLNATDTDAANNLTVTYGFTPDATCDAATLAAASPVTIGSPAASPVTTAAIPVTSAQNTQYVCAAVNDGAVTTYQASANPVNIDATDPMVAVSGGPGTISDLTPFTVTVTFDENVTGFGDVLTDVVATNGDVTAIAGSGAGPYTISITPTGGGDVVVTVPAGVATDDAGNDNAASAPLTISSVVLATRTTETIVDATEARVRGVLANQPNLTPLLADREEWYFDASADNNSAFLKFFKGPMWFNLDYSRSEVGSLESSTVFGVIGSHQQFSENLIIGSMLQFDIMESEDGDFSQSSNGILAGPYFVASNDAQTLFYDGSLLLGVTNNEISPTGEYTDEYLSKRWLATLKVSGNIERDTFTLRPNVDLKYISDENDGFTDSMGNVIDASGINVGEAAVGFDAIIPMNVDNGALKLLVGAHGIYAKQAFTGAASAIRESTEDGRGRIDLGFEWQGDESGIFKAQMYFDGLGADDYASQGLSLTYEITF
jgi:hypothetical protein